MWRMGTGASGEAVAPTAPRTAARAWGMAPQLRAAVAVVVVGLWIAWAVLTWQGSERLVTDEQFHADLSAGRIETWRLATDLRHQRSWPPDGSPAWDYGLVAQDEDSGMPSSSDPRPVSGLVYWVHETVGPTRIAGTGPGAGPLSLMSQLQSAGVSQRPLSYEARPADHGDQWGMGAFLLALVAVVVGPRPSRGTRWFWFWVQWVPWGLGTVLYAVAELVRPGGPMRVVGRTGTVGRRRLLGWEGVVAVVLGGFLVAAVSGGLRSALGPMWVPGG